MEKDQVIIDRLKAGDSGVIDEIVDKYKNPLFAFIIRMVNNYDLAEDIFQETWIRVIRHIHTFRGDAKFSTWLFQIAGNLCRDMIRKNKRRSYVPLDEAKEILRTPSDSIEDSSRMEFVREIVAGLPVKMREVIVLRYYHDFSIKEISEILRCSEGTVKSRTFRAIEIIRKKRKVLFNKI